MQNTNHTTESLDVARANAADATSLMREGAPKEHPQFDRLVRTIWRLRQEDGCPWDKVQTHASIARNMLEEAYEAYDTIEQNDTEHMREELGDVLMQVVLHAQIAADSAEFNIDDVCQELNEKLVRRHPHVFGAQNATNPDEVLSIWEDVKAAERTHKDETQQGLLDSVPSSMPSLMQAQKLSKRAAKVGFDWEDAEGVWAKVEEEKQEFLAEAPGTTRAEEEFGDLLFALVNVARKQGVDAEAALRGSCERFRSRFGAMEQECASRGIPVETADAAQLDEMWERAKRK